MKYPIPLAAVTIAIAVLSGCDTVSETLNKRPPVDVAQPTAMRAPAVAAAPVGNGSIFQSGQYRPLFEDYRARLVGDTLTVQIVEKISASQKSNSTVDKSGKVDGSVTALPMLKLSALTRASVAG